MSDNIALAVAYYLNGIIFRQGAEKLGGSIDVDDARRPTKLTAIPLYFLGSHAAELFLKAALLKRGFDASSLKNFDYRHNLSALLAEVVKLKIPVSSDTISIVEGLSEQHRTHQLRYTVLVDEGKKTFWPPLPCVFEALDELLMLTRISTHGI